MKGSHPVIKYEHKRKEKHCVLRALNSDHFIYELSDKLNSDIFKNFILRQIDQFKKVVNVIDHGPYHISKIMQESYAEKREHLHVEYFPSYSPELDSIEQS